MKNIYLLIACICGLLLPIATSAQTFTSVDIYAGADSSNPYGFTEYNNKLYFVATDGVHGYELWVSDGTQGGTQIVKDIWPGTGSSNPSYLTVMNGKLYFDATDSVHGYELWVTDGTAGGTNLVKDIYQGSISGAPSYMFAFNNTLFFEGTDSAHGSELWASDGTTAGTVLVSDINPGTVSSYPGYYSNGFYVYNGKVYFNANDGTHGYELWVTDGTSGGTSMIKDIFPGTGNSYAGYTYENTRGFITLNNKMYFEANDSVHGYELWATDGTTAGTVLVSDIWTGPGSSYPGYYGGFNALNGKFYFSANDSVHGFELWVSDGTAGGTLLVSDINPGAGGSYPMYLAVAGFNNRLYFSAVIATGGYQLYVTDGTTAGTNAVTSIYTSSSSGFDPYQLTTFNNELFFEGTDSTLGWQLYSMNTADSLMLLAPPIAPNPSPLYDYSALYPFNGSLAFAANYNSIGNELWFYTPVPAAIGHVQALNGIDVYPNPFTSQITLTGLQNSVEYHLILSDIQGRELEQYQLTGTGATNTLHLPATLASGMYLLQLSNGNLPGVTGQTGAAETVKIVKE